MDVVPTTPSATVLLDATDAAVYASAGPATLCVWRHRYRLTPHSSPTGANLYDLAELADVLARREAPAQPTVVASSPGWLDVLDRA